MRSCRFALLSLVVSFLTLAGGRQRSSGAIKRLLASHRANVLGGRLAVV